MAITKISIRGRMIAVPSVDILGRTIIMTGKCLKVASIRDQEWLEGEPAKNPNAFIAALTKSPLRPDIFTFSEVLGATTYRRSFHPEPNNAAVIPITTYADWWEHRLPQTSRKNVRRSERRGVTVGLTPFTDEFIHGITHLYNETPVRQGRRFWHYGKDFETVKQDNSSYLERSDFVAAYHNSKLIAFMKIVYVRKIARIMQILSSNEHFDKRPANALIAKAVELCCQKRCSHLVYGKYIYDNKDCSSVTEFKRRNGFEQVVFPTYYIPLSHKGRLAIALKLHLGFKRVIPRQVVNPLLKMRSRLYERTILRSSLSRKDTLLQAI